MTPRGRNSWIRKDLFGYPQYASDGVFLQPVNFFGKSFRGRPQGIVGQVGIALGRRNLSVAQESAHDRQSEAAGHEVTGVSVPQVVQTGVVDPRLG